MSIVLTEQPAPGVALVRFNRPEARNALNLEVRRLLAQHLTAYGEVDVALDTFPYHGTTTTCEALWMGVPVITLVGDRHASRVGLSLLTAIGHSEWVATSADSYINRAIELAQDAARLTALRASLRGEMSRSALLDHPGQAARFADALRTCLRPGRQGFDGHAAVDPQPELADARGCQAAAGELRPGPLGRPHSALAFANLPRP